MVRIQRAAEKENLSAAVMRKPLAIDLYAGLGGWTDGLLAEGWEVWGFDIERHQYGWKKCIECDGTGNYYRHDEDGDFLSCDCYENYGGEHAGEIPNRYPGQLILMDVRQIHGAMFKDADLIVASPPCQEFSYRAMPWKRAKALPPPLLGTNLFWQCWRIQQEACEAKGQYIPMVVENVKGAQKWVGRAVWHYRSQYLWGDVPALMPKGEGNKHGGDWFSGTGDANGMDKSPMRLYSSGSRARKAASAQIAKIPLPLSRHIGKVFYPA